MPLSPFDRRALPLVLSPFVALGACEPQTASQTIVVVHAEPSLLERARTVHVRVLDDEGAVALERSKPVNPNEASVARIPLVPRGGDVTRRFVVSAELLDEGSASLGRLEVRGGYVSGERHDLHVWFESSCTGVACGEGQTCQGGACVGSCFDVTREGDRASALCGECEVCATTCTPASDIPCGCPGETCSAGRCAPREQVALVSAGTVHTCAAVTGGKVYCWGSTIFSSISTAGRLGTGHAGVDSPSPVVVEGATATVALSAGSEHTCALTANERTCWGRNYMGQLGGPTLEAVQPVPASFTTPALQTLASGFRHTCGLGRGSSDIFCWGYDGRGNLGTEAPPDPVYAPVKVGDGYRMVAAGGDHTCAVRLDGALECWGFNDSGQLGAIGASGERHVRPGCELTNTPGACFGDYQRVALGAFHTCGLRANGELYCWGGNQSAQLGVGPPTSAFNRTEPVLVVGGPWSDVAAGRGHTCALDALGALYCWGLNDDRQLGLPSIDTVNLPTRVDATGLGQLRSIALGGRHTCALTAERRLYCWGRNDEGQVGVGIATDAPVETPRRVCF